MENHTTDIPTHYKTLGLASSAPVAVIRAAYKALALQHHPDKTPHLSPEERASRASIFCGVQEAYDVLSNPALKAAYDDELEHHGNRVDQKRSTFHRTPTGRKTPSTTPKRSPSIRLTSPDEKRAMKAKAEQDLAYLREQRGKRDAVDATMDVAGLKSMHKIWTDLAKEHADDESLQAHCAIQLQMYEEKIAKREKEHADWLASMSKPKTGAQTPPSKAPRASTPNAPRKPATSRFAYASSSSSASPSPVTNPAPASTLRQRAEERKRAEAYRAEQSSLRAQARAEEKTRKDAAKQAQLEAKHAFVRAWKDGQKQEAEAQSKQAAERIAKARAKAGAAPKGTVGAGRPAGDVEAAFYSVREERSGSAYGSSKPKVKKSCDKCGVEHGSFAEWRRCNARQATQQHSDCEDDDSFFFRV